MTDPGSRTAPRNLRRDAQRSHIVDHGLAMQEGANTVCAVEYLKSRGIPAAVIERVLLDPARRRGARHEARSASPVAAQ